jgi:exodeoxyribonuclease-5
MEWTPQQDTALKRVNDWLNGGYVQQQVFKLFGYAGTGKTTMAKELASGVEGPVFFGAYTGKAASVLRAKGCPGASTIHSMIYRSREKSRLALKLLEQELVEARQLATHEGRDEATCPIVCKLAAEVEQERQRASGPVFDLNPDSPIRDAALVVIDECSMVDGEMGEDLLSFGTPVLVLGDPAQLPPVMGGGFFTEDKNPDVMLTDIQRQARDNPIIAMAARVREGGELPIGKAGTSRVLERGYRLDPQEVLAMDQLLVGKNTTRHGFNRRMRQLHERGGEFPVEGDKLVCLRNNHELGLLNGAQWTTVSSFNDEDGPDVTLEIRPIDATDANEEPKVVNAHKAPFRGEKVDVWTRKDAEEFDFGYAMTCHKAQGSQWDNVLIVDESWVFRQDRNRWLYTAITRAASSVTVLKT